MVVKARSPPPSEVCVISRLGGSELPQTVTFPLPSLDLNGSKGTGEHALWLSRQWADGHLRFRKLPSHFLPALLLRVVQL